MRSNMSTGNPGYSPLPQSNSDSEDSEEELRLCHQNKVCFRPVDVQVSKPAKTVSVLGNNVIKYKPVDNDKHVDETFTKFQSTLDEIIIQKSNTSEKFSTCRKICFVFSLFLCVFTTVAFIWILPCNIESCPAMEDMKSLIPSDSKNYNYTWKKILPNLEIIGPCSLVSDSFSKNQNLVFLARNYSHLASQLKKNFLLSLKGDDGSLKWRVKFERELSIIDCRLIDIDLDGINDCLLFDKDYIATVNSVTGKEIWNNDNLKKRVKLIFLNFPLILPDVNNDKVKDLLFTYSFMDNGQKHISVSVVSGKTGEVLGKPYQIKFCESLHNLMLLTNNSLIFTCHNVTKKFVFKVNLMDIFRTVWTLSKISVNFSNWEKLKQYEKQSNTVFLSGLQLILENKGHCPGACNIFINIKDEQKVSSNKSIYSFNRKNTFGMTPVKFKSKFTRGFILKFWEWNGKVEKLYFQNNVIYPKQNFGKIDVGLKQRQTKNKNLSDVTVLDQEMFSESNQSVTRDKRTSNNFRRPEDEINLRFITETLVKVTYKNNNLNVKNLCKDEIIQICKNQYNCHPDIYQQKQSSLVGCFNGNERKKLVTFTSEIINSKINESWQIQSKVQMLNFE